MINRLGHGFEHGLDVVLQPSATRPQRAGYGTFLLPRFARQKDVKIAVITTPHGAS